MVERRETPNPTSWSFKTMMAQTSNLVCPASFKGTLEHTDKFVLVESKLPQAVQRSKSEKHKVQPHDGSTDELGDDHPPPRNKITTALISKNSSKSEARTDISESQLSLREFMDKPLPPIPLQIRRPLQALKTRTSKSKLTSLSKNEATTLNDSPKFSPLKRSKDAIWKATRTIAGKFRGGNPSHIPSERGNKYAFIDDCRPSTRDLNDNLRHLHTKTQRKPLPVYESMRSRRETIDGSSLSPERKIDIVTAVNDAPVEKPAIIGLDISFDHRKVKSMKSKSSLQDHSSVNNRSPGDTVARHQRRRTFSNALSGLAQHPTSNSFSSSPVDHSTPKIRLDPAPSEDLNPTIPHKQPRRSPSIIEFSFEQSASSDDTSSPTKPLLNAKPMDTSEDELSPNVEANDAPQPSTQSVKRKSSEIDLRSRLHPDNKRPKTYATKDDTKLSSQLRKLATQDDSAATAGKRVLGERDPNASLTVRRPNTADPKSSSTSTTTKGLDIFQLPKGKGPALPGSNDLMPSTSTSSHAPLLGPAATTKRTRGRPLSTVKHVKASLGNVSSGIPRRPTSILFSRESRESRGVARKRKEWEKVREGNRDEDPMEVDELA